MESPKPLFSGAVPSEIRRNAVNVYEDTGTETRYAEQTWSHSQILCDSLQNNLDAETRKFISELESSHIANAGANSLRAKEDPEWKQEYLALLNLLYTLAYRAGDLQAEEKDEMLSMVHAQADELGVLLRGVEDKNFVNSERPPLPELTYAVQDVKTGKITRHLTRQDLLNPPFNNIDEFKLFEWRVDDSGGGYDVTKSVLYLPTKQGEAFSRGVFGIFADALPIK
jgi:hypothetical protein